MRGFQREIEWVAATDEVYVDKYKTSSNYCNQEHGVSACVSRGVSAPLRLLQRS